MIYKGQSLENACMCQFTRTTSRQCIIFHLPINISPSYQFFTAAEHRRFFYIVGGFQIQRLFSFFSGGKHQQIFNIQVALTRSLTEKLNALEQRAVSQLANGKGGICLHGYILTSRSYYARKMLFPRSC